MPLIFREFVTAQRIGASKAVLCHERVWVRRDLVLTFRTRQAVSLVDTPVEVLADARQRVVGLTEVFADVTQDVLAPLAEGTLAVLILGDLDTAADTLQVVGLPAEVFADAAVLIGQEIAVETDAFLTIQDVLADARLRLVIWGTVAEGDLRCAVSGPVERDADLGQNILAWLGDQDTHQRIGEIVRQESHLFH